MTMIVNPSNLLSLLRGPLIFLFAIDDPLYRSLAIILAMASDVLDGYLARRLRMVSQFGAFLDPLMDKIFAFFAVCIFMHESKLELWQALVLLSRDFAVLIFGVYLTLRKNWSNFQFHSIWSGKVTTTLQFLVFLGLTFQLAIPPFVFGCFVLFGFLALFELYCIEQRFFQHIK